MTEEFDTLCAAALEGTASEAQQKRLQQILKEDPTARANYLQQSRLHALLTWQSGQATFDQVGEEKVVAFPTWRRVAPIAAAVILFVGIIAFLNNRPAAQGVAFEVIGTDGTTEFSLGDQLFQKSLKLSSGSLTFKLNSGAVVEAIAPFEMQLHDSMHLSVLSGAVTVDVGKDAKGFIVDTLNARVVDLGTRFGVSVGSEDTDIVVFEGEVEVYQPSSSDSQAHITNLVGGEAVRVDSQWTAKRLAAVALNGESLAILGGNGTNTPVISRVSDDINDIGFHRFYSIHPRGMRENFRAYSTLGSPHWEAIPGKKFPGRLKGADALRTFSEDRKDPSLQLSIEVTEPSTVYIMLDSRSTPPKWLQSDFKKLRQQVRSGPWNPLSSVTEGLAPNEDGELYVNYSIWTREINSPGSFTLGPPRLPNEPRNRAMYGVAVKPHSIQQTPTQ